MNKDNSLLAVLAVVLLAGPTVAQAQPSYDFQQINNPGTTYTQIFGINDRGEVVGNGTFGGLDTFPFVYASKKSTLTLVATPIDYAFTSVMGITDSGVMVGSVRSQDLSTVSGMIRGKDGTFKFFSHPDAGSFTQARGVNNKGLVTGYRDTQASSLPQTGFIYDPETDSFTDLVPNSRTIAHGINSQDQVVGDSRFSGVDDPCRGAAGPVFRYGWLRATDGSIGYFRVNGLDTVARGINDVGTVVGFVLDFVAEEIKGFVVQLDGSPCQSLTIADSDLLEFPGFDVTIPEGITNSGVIVGQVNIIDPQGFIVEPRGFIATPSED